jgi:hypothetical protein
MKKPTFHRFEEKINLCLDGIDVDLVVEFHVIPGNTDEWTPRMDEIPVDDEIEIVTVKDASGIPVGLTRDEQKAAIKQLTSLAR